MLSRFDIWLHRVKGHELLMRRVTPALFDITARGELWRCSCGKVWAL